MSIAESAATAEAAVGKYEELRVSAIKPSQWNPRQSFDEAGLAELVASIRQHGVIEPIVVRHTVGWLAQDPDTGVQFEIVCGERRWRAAQKAGLETIPAIVRTDLDIDERATRLLMLTENLLRHDLDPIEEAQAYMALRDMGLKQAEIAEQLGVSQPVVSNSMRLLGLPDDVKQRVSAGEISQSHARALAAYPAKAASKLAAAAAEGKLTTKQLEACDYTAQDALGNDCRRMYELGEDTIAAECRDKCEYYRKGDVCLNAECYRAKVKAKHEAARAELAKNPPTGGVYTTDQLKGVNYRWLNPAPVGCRADCEKRAVLTAAGWQHPICVDGECYNRLEAEDRKRAEDAAKQKIKEQMAALQTEMDTTKPLPRVMVIVAMEALKRVEDKTAKQAFARHNLGIGEIDLYDLDQRGAYLDELASVNPVTLLVAVAEAIMTPEIRTGIQWHQGQMPMTDWYLANSPGEQEAEDGKSG